MNATYESSIAGDREAESVTDRGPVTHRVSVYWDASDPKSAGWAYQYHRDSGYGPDDHRSGPLDGPGSPWDGVERIYPVFRGIETTPEPAGGCYTAR